MENITPAQIWSIVAWVAAAVVLLANAAEKITKTVQAAKAPNARQDERLSALEVWREEVDRKLSSDKKELGEIHDGLRASHLAQLALLDHALNGNNVTQMQDAKAALQKYLANK